jgi:pimeloyl-ACP methyl ester carboxylesterase
VPIAHVNSIDLFYTDEGIGDPVVLLHGLGSSSGDWELQLPVLTPNHRVIAVDMRGHGRSDKPPGPYSIAMFATDVAALIEHLDIGPCDVVGLSLGAMTTLELAASRPELVRSAVVVNAGPDFIPRTFKERAMVWQRKTLARVVPLAKIGEIIAARTLPGEEHAELRERVAGVIADNDKDAYRASMNAIIGWSVRDRLPTISARTLVVASELDYGSIESKQPIVDEAPNATMVVVDGARHLLPVEKPDEFNRILSQFLDPAR